MLFGGRYNITEGPGFLFGDGSKPYMGSVDLMGNPVWTRDYSTSGAPNGRFFDIKSDANFLYSSGQLRTTATSFDPSGLLIKTDQAGGINGSCSTLLSATATSLPAQSTALTRLDPVYGWSNSIFVTPVNGVYSGSSGSLTLAETSCVGSGGTVLSGAKFIDFDCNQLMDGADVPAVGYEVQLRNSSGFLLQTVFTDNAGAYSFNVFTPGTYYIYVITQGSSIIDLPSAGFHTVVVNNQVAIPNLDFSSCLCTDQVGVNGPPAWTNLGGSFQSRDLAYFDGDIFGISFSPGDEIHKWDHLASSWTLFYKNSTDITELETINGDLYYGGSRPGYFMSGTTTPIAINTAGSASTGYDVIYDFEEIGGTIYAGGDFSFASPGSGSIRTINGSNVTAITPPFIIPGSANQAVGSIGQYNGNLIAMGGFDDGNMLKRIAQYNLTNSIGTIAPLAGGINLPMPGSGNCTACAGDIVEHNGRLYVMRTFNQAIDASGTNVPGTFGYTIWDGSTWEQNTSLSSPVSFHDADVVNGYVYIVGFFSEIDSPPTPYGVGVIYDPVSDTYGNLGLSNYTGVAEAIMYVPNYKNQGDVLAFFGEGNFYLGTCSGDGCNIGAFGQDVCLGDPVFFQSFLPGLGNCSWDFGDGNTATQCNPSHTYAAAGSYTVTLSYTNADGCNEQTTTIVSVSEVSADFISSQGACYDVSFDSSSSVVGGTSPFTYSWDVFDDNAIESSLANFTYDFQSLGAGTYTVCLEISNAEGCTDRICKQVVVTPDTTIPSITCPSNPAIAIVQACDRGANVSFGSATGDDCGDPVAISCSHSSGDFFPCGLTTVVCTATDDEGSTSSCSISVVVDCECLDIVNYPLQCSAVPDTYLFEIDVIDLSGANGNCVVPVVTTAQTGVSLVTTSSTPIANGYKVTGEIFTQNCPMPYSFALDATMTCTCPDLLPNTCSGTTLIPTICCDEISLSPQNICSDAGTVQLATSHFGTIKDIVQTNWYVQARVGSCPTVPWGGTPFSSSAGYSDLIIVPSVLSGQLCYYAEYLLGSDEGPCTMLTSNVSTIDLCDPFTCSLDDQEFCYTGSPITPAPLVLNTVIPNCSYTIEWYELIGGVEFLLPYSGQTTFQPPSLSIANPAACEKTFTYIAEYNGPCGPIRCTSEIRLDNGLISLGNLAEVTGAPVPLCYGEDATLQFSENCPVDGRTWSWFSKPSVSNTWLPIANNGLNNTIYNTNSLFEDTDFRIEISNRSCPIQNIAYNIDVKAQMSIGSLSAVGISPCNDAGLNFSIPVTPCVSSANACDCDYTASLYRNGNLITTGAFSSSPVTFSYVDPTLGGDYKGNYRVVITDNCCNNSLASNIVLIDSPPSVLINGPCYTCDNSSPVTLAAGVRKPVTSIFTYQWYRVVAGTDIIIPGQTAQNLTVTTAGVYKLIVTFTNGCEVSDTYTVDNCTTNSIAAFNMISSSGSYRFQTANRGVQLYSPNGTMYILVANNSGQITTVPCWPPFPPGNIDVQALDVLVEGSGEGAVFAISNNSQKRISVDNNGLLTETTTAITTDPSDIIIQDGDLNFDESTRGLVIKSPNGKLWRMSVSDLGEIYFELVSM